MTATHVEGAVEAMMDVQEGTITHFHARFGHLAYETIERKAKNSPSGIRLSDTKRSNCRSSAQAK